MENKFLADGRKVAIVGQLNQQEWIVQEIFVTENGDEIPAGERFTTKSLLDQPAKSYKQKEIDRQEERIAKNKAEIDRIEKLLSERRCEEKAQKEVLKCIKGAVGEVISGEDLGTLVDFLTGSIQWITQDRYSHSDPVPFLKSVSGTERGWGGEMRFEDLKLISLYGGSDGNLSYKLSRYSDGSGDSTDIWGYRTYQEAARKSIELTIGRIIQGNSYRIASDLLNSKAAEYLTESEVELAKSVIRENIKVVESKQAENRKSSDERDAKEIAELTALLGE
ncbi:hypothetical protein J7J47_16435 [Halomonas sp. ISL-60]|uniref:hypothetical protein n=1 Tax=Halomonas sp. ISL-56 TaxID=2819149 RepID=UPI001BE6866C|nr:hypothetical protein [Halomonas sp. ISL-56]MBT2773811.1 hypothetical protein [Halomonas sp. ISL-60]MBT2800005.1 hypothetical protein [Halomonas sp. ISL-56]